ncbi:MAG: hypothetical protein LBU81_06875 [Methanosarcinales archaeon]|jgi:hypothetical protein|nr:hypothetical protein [Methanosarcinales archaeon]
MGQEEINEAYGIFKIPPNSIPSYINSNESAHGFKKFSLLKNVNITYSNTTETH